MATRDNKFVDRWGKHRELGRSHLVWHHGVMGREEFLVDISRSINYA